MNLAQKIRRGGFFKALIVILLYPGLILWPAFIHSNPQEGEVVSGTAEIIDEIEGALQILQESDSAIIEWESFSIDGGELTEFIQSGKDAAVLNRVKGSAASHIDGMLKANGKVLLINQNGIVIGAEGVVDTAGFIASALDVSNEEFEAGGDMVFRGASTAEVLNLGRIKTDGGDVILIARSVRNDGHISANGGLVGLAAGQEVLLMAVEDANGERIFVRPGQGLFTGYSLLDHSHPRV